MFRVVTGTREAKVGRRVIYVLVFVGFFLVFFSLLVRFYAYPRLQKAPLNQYSQPVATGTATYFNRAKLREVTAQLQNVRTVKGDPRAGSSGTAVWDSFEVTKDLGDGGVIEVIQERIALDRVSAESRNCCGDRPRHEGLTLKFPFNTRKTGYSFWDSRAQQAFPATFVGEEKVRGVKVYRFEQHFSGVPLDTIQVSGVIVKAAENQTQILQTADGHPVLTGFRGQLAWDDATVRENADDASSAASQLRLIQTILPIVALALGVVLVVLGVALVARQPSRPANEPAPETRPADA